jgi:hypothetical protein
MYDGRTKKNMGKKGSAVKTAGFEVKMRSGLG